MKRFSFSAFCVFTIVGGAFGSATSDGGPNNRFVGYEKGTDCPRLTVEDALFDNARDRTVARPREIMLNDAHWSVNVTSTGTVLPAFGKMQDSVRFEKNKNCAYHYTRVKDGGQVGITFILTKLRDTDDMVQLMHGFETALQTLVKDYEAKGLARATLVEKMKAFEG